ncbi:MAG: lysine--tRNA ligase, partial [Candidatus Liptonbacteria bacterium]|nr:lysine--tRNA ligase [Candidatus Liptonbacteria bacterium]
MIEALRDERLKKLTRLKQAGIEVYPSEAKRSFPIKEARDSFNKLFKSKKKVVLSGRIWSTRDQGNIIFLDLADESGKIQGVLTKKNLKDFKIWKENLDRGDFISIAGPVFKTKKGEMSVEAKSVSILAKSLLPVPNEWYGVGDDELRLRQRYLELLTDPGVTEIFKKKAVFWRAFRDFLLNENFLEVETPVLEQIPGGAEAEPFKTHMKALDIDLFLRISLELPLKKLIVGGYEKVFEIGRVFRNEGIDKEHLQDYTQLEFYWAYHEYEDLMKLLEKMYKEVIKKTTGGLKTSYEGKKIDWGKKWKKVDYVEAFKKAVKLDPLSATSAELLEKARALNLGPEPNAGKGRLIDLIFKKTVRPSLIDPCFLIDPPVEIEPLAKRHRKDPRRVERLQVMAAGTELGKGFSELNDPLDQRARFEEQMRLREAGDTEAQRLDEDFVEALEYGMPPTAGFGVSERLFAILMDKPVRETVFFPLMRPKSRGPERK